MIANHRINISEQQKNKNDEPIQRYSMAIKTCPSLLYLWDKRTLYLGPLFDTLKFSQGAATLIVSLEAPLSFQMTGMNEPVSTKSLLVPAGISLEVNTHNAVIANCNLDPVGADFTTLYSLMTKQSNGISYQLSNETAFISCYKKIYQDQFESKKAYEKLEELISSGHKNLINHYFIDQRIVKVITLIKQTIDNNLSVDELAESVNLSTPRLVQLFKRQTGIPIRRYRLWHRLYVSANLVGQGENFTDAALAAGFTDSSHYCRTFRSMFGMTPSRLIEQPNNLRIIISENTHR